MRFPDNLSIFCLLLLVLVPGLTGGCNMARVTPRRDIFGHLPKNFAQTLPGEETFFLTWQQSFGSARLVEDLKQLESRNYTLAAARSRVEQAAIQYGLVAAGLGPSPVSVNTKFERERETEDNSDITHSNTYTLSASFGWEADIWGRLRAGKKAAALLMEEQEALAGQTLLELQSRLVMYWIDYHAARRLRQLVAIQQKKNRQLLALIRLQAGLGLGSRLDVLQQSRHLAELDKSVTTIDTDAKIAANAYQILLGCIPQGKPLPPESLPCPPPLLSLPGPRQLLSLRPDLQAAFAALGAADHEVAAAIADRLPRIAFGFSYEISGSSPAAIGNDSALSLLANLLTPVFDAGRKSMMVKQRKAQAQIAMAVLHQTMLDAFLEVENAVVTERNLYSKLTLLDRELAIAGQTLEEAMFRYVNGEEAFLSVLLADISLNRLEQEKIYSQKALLLNRVRLLRALGAGMSNPAVEEEHDAQQKS